MFFHFLGRIGNHFSYVNRRLCRFAHFDSMGLLTLTVINSGWIKPPIGAEL